MGPLGSLTPHNQKTKTMVGEVPLLLPLYWVFWILKCQCMYFFEAVQIYGYELHV